MARSANMEARSAGADDRAPARPRKRASRPPATRDPEGTRQRILDAATQEFSRLGLGGARVDRIAEEAGANKRMLYYYFGDKDGLFLAVLENTYAGIRSAEQALQLLHTPPVAAVARLVEFTWRYYLEHPEFLTLLNSENLHRARHLARSKNIRTMNSPLIETLREVLARGAANGVFRRGVDPLQLYVSIAGLAYFYLSNNYTLSQVFDRDLAAPPALDARLAHMIALVTGFLTSHAAKRSAKLTARGARG